MALEELISKEENVEKILEKILKERVKLIQEVSEKYVHIRKELARKLDNFTRILLYLAGKKAWELIEEKKTGKKIEYWIKPKEIENNLQLSGGSVRPVLRQMKKGKLIDCKQKMYRINFAGILELEERIKKYEERKK